MPTFLFGKRGSSHAMCHTRMFTGLLCMLLGTASVHAQSRAYTLSELTNAAVHHFPSIQRKQALVSSANAGIADVRSSYLPKLTASDQVNVATDNSIAGTYLPMAPIPSSSAGVRADNNYTPAGANLASLYSEYTLTDFGYRGARIAEAQAGKNLQEADLARETYLLKWQVCRLYFNLLKSQFQLQNDHQNLDRYQQIFRVIKAVTASGITAGVDSSLARAEMSRTMISLNQQVANYHQLQAELSYLSGFAVDSLVLDSLTTGFGAPLRIGRDSLPRAYGTLPLGIFDTVMVNTADTSNPLLDYYRRNADLYAATEKATSKGFTPKILLAGSLWARGSSIQYDDDFKSVGYGFGYQRFNYGVGLAFTYDLFSGFRRRTKMAMARFQTQAGNYEVEQQQLSLQNSVAQADAALAATRDNLGQLPLQLKAAADVYRQKLAQYKAGMVNLIDLTNATYVLYRSQTDYVQTLGDWYLQHVDKAAATGKLDDFIQQIQH